jgi:hypothetical protein
VHVVRSFCDPFDVGKHAGVASNSTLGNRGVFRIEFDQDGVTAKAISDQASRSGAAEWIEDHAAGGAASLDAGLD